MGPGRAPLLPRGPGGVRGAVTGLLRPAPPAVPTHPRILFSRLLPLPLCPKQSLFYEKD